MESPYLSSIKNCRVVVLLEAEPLSNKYHQFVLKKEDFKKLSDMMYKFYPEDPNVIIDGAVARVIELEDQVVILNPEVKSFRE